MDMRAKCANEKCEFNGIERSVPIGQILGYGTANGRVECPGCGSLMVATKTVAVRARVKSRRRSPRDLKPLRSSGRH
jgi:hypothetical protein